jgi:hypothetical protein
VDGASSELVCLLVLPARYVTEGHLVEAAGQAQDDALKALVHFGVLGLVIWWTPPPT